MCLFDFFCPRIKNKASNEPVPETVTFKYDKLNDRVTPTGSVDNWIKLPEPSLFLRIAYRDIVVYKNTANVNKLPI